MNEMKVTVAVDIEIKGVKLSLTKAEATSLLFQLQNAVGEPAPVERLNLNQYPSTRDIRFGQPLYVPHTGPYRPNEITC